jgi:hypothetical protein
VFRMSIPNGIPGGIPALESSWESQMGSQTVSRSRESRSSSSRPLGVEVVCGWSVAKKSSNATAVEARGGFKTDGRYAAGFGGVR